MAGPQRARLDQALTGAHAHAVTTSSREWTRCVGILQEIAAALLVASPQVKREIGGRTGPAIDAAFQRSSDAMTRRAADLAKGSAALQSAADAIAAALAEQEYLAGHPLKEPTPYVAGPGPRTDEDIAKEAAARQAQSDYDAAYADQEARAKARADHLDEVFARSTAVMKDIHQVPDPEPSTSGSGSNGSGGGGGATPLQHMAATSGGSGPRNPGPTITYSPDGDGAGAGSGDHHAATGGPGTTPAPGGTGAPQGGSTIEIPGRTPGIGPSSGPVPVGSTGGLGLGLAGAAAGGIGGSLLGTGLAAGGLRGGLTPVVTGPGTAAGGVRGIGATSRAGVSGTLGRPGGVAAVGSGTGTAGTTGRGTAARSSGVASGRGTTGRGPGSRGAAGSRGAGGRGTGSTAGGRSGRKTDQRGRHDPFDTVAEDWVDHEEPAPGVLD
jgi:hypothetical protein